MCKLYIDTYPDSISNMKKKTTIILALGILLSTTAMLNLPLVKADTLVDSFWVYSDGTPVESVVLEFGKKYKIVADEVFSYGYPYQADAMYYTTNTDPWQWTNHFSAPDGHSFLQINGQDVDWGPFSNGDTGHTYTIYMMGEDDSLTFRIVDWIDDDYSNNYCHLPVEIYEVPYYYYGATPGFWKNHPDAWQGYDPSDGVCSVFSEAAAYVPCTDMLMDALNYPGGRGAEGAARILLRAATAAVLNAEHSAINYPLTTAEITTSVNSALASGDRGVMISLASILDTNNNLGTPWD